VKVLPDLLQLFFFEDLNRVISKFDFVQRYPARVNISGNMLRELAQINSVVDFAAQRVLILECNRIAFSQLKHERKALVESRIIDLNRFHRSYHCWFSPFFKMRNADRSTSPPAEQRLSGIQIAIFFRNKSSAMLVSERNERTMLMSVQRLRNDSFALN
jgi:hypothetical protein